MNNLDKQNLIKFLENKKQEITYLVENPDYDDPILTNWKDEVVIDLIEIYGKFSREIEVFEAIKPNGLLGFYKNDLNETSAKKYDEDFVKDLVSYFDTRIKQIQLQPVVESVNISGVFNSNISYNSTGVTQTTSPLQENNKKSLFINITEFILKHVIEVIILTILGIITTFLSLQ